MTTTGAPRTTAPASPPDPLDPARRLPWAVAGIVAGLAGLGVSYAASGLLEVRVSPVLAVAQGIIKITPGGLAEALISVVGTYDKPLLVVGVLVATTALFAWAGLLARRAWWMPSLVFAALAVVGAVAVLAEPGSTGPSVLPVAVGFVAWVVGLSLMTDPLTRARLTEREPGAAGESRRTFLVRAAVIGGLAALTGVVGRFVGGDRRAVEESRRLLRLDGVTAPEVPAAARVGVDGVSPWLTPVEEFYRIDTALVVPVIEPSQWRLRIHGMVERELTISYDDLMGRQFTEGFTTICCVSNPVGGDLIGNAWWSGVRIAELMAEAGVSPDADAVLQTSSDGWSCGTPLAALTDDRDALLAVAMDGRPLPIEHGFPVRSIVPGLYGYVSATKWVVDMEVTRFDRIDAYWTQRGWGELGPVKISSRIDVPASGDEVGAGAVTIGGVAWAQHTGIAGVEVQVDGGAWVAGEIADAGLPDAWVQWRAEVDLAEGDHLVRVRATDRDGRLQDETVRDVLPDGATGYNAVDVRAT